MRIASLVEVARGRLLNRPSISSASGFSFSPKTTRRGDCYIHLGGDLSAIDQAIANGAFVVVFASEIRAIETETALIFAEDINRALCGIARYLLLEKSASVFVGTVNQIEIAGSLIVDRKLLVNPSFEAAILALNSEAPHIFLCDEKSDFFSAAIAPIALKKSELAIVKEGLFETTILHNDEVLTIALSSLFAAELASAIRFAEENKLRFNLTREIAIGRFKIRRIDERVLIFDFASETQAQTALKFIKRIAPWAKIFAPQNGVEEFAKEFRNARFNYAYFNRVSEDDFDRAIESAKPPQLELF